MNDHKPSHEDMVATQPRSLKFFIAILTTLLLIAGFLVAFLAVNEARASVTQTSNQAPAAASAPDRCRWNNRAVCQVLYKATRMTHEANAGYNKTYRYTRAERRVIRNHPRLRLHDLYDYNHPHSKVKTRSGAKGFGCSTCITSKSLTGAIETSAAAGAESCGWFWISRIQEDIVLPIELFKVVYRADVCFKYRADDNNWWVTKKHSWIETHDRDFTVQYNGQDQIVNESLPASSWTNRREAYYSECVFKYGCTGYTWNPTFTIDAMGPNHWTWKVDWQ
jgi:hypothetical protein